MVATATTTSTQHVSRRLFNVHEFHQMAEAGILHRDERVELIEGDIVQKSPISGPHIKRLNVVTNLLNRALGDRVEVSPLNSVRLSERTESMPDIAVLRFRGDDDSVPVASDVLVVIEIAVSSLRRDLGEKLLLYARARIPEAWVLDVNGVRLIQHGNPSAGQYRKITELRPGESISIPEFPDVPFSVADFFGKQRR
jgi:Uma2 family endonuclease